MSNHVFCDHCGYHEAHNSQDCVCPGCDEGVLKVISEEELDDMFLPDRDLEPSDEELEEQARYWASLGNA